MEAANSHDIAIVILSVLIFLFQVQILAIMGDNIIMQLDAAAKVFLVGTLTLYCGHKMTKGIVMPKTPMFGTTIQIDWYAT